MRTAVSQDVNQVYGVLHAEVVFVFNNTARNPVAKVMEHYGKYCKTFQKGGNRAAKLFSPCFSEFSVDRHQRIVVHRAFKDSFFASH